MTTSAPITTITDVPYPVPREPLRLPSAPEPAIPFVVAPVRVPVTMPLRRV